MARIDVDWKSLVKNVAGEFEEGLKSFLKTTAEELKEYGEDLAKLTVRVMMETDGELRKELLEEVGINALLIAERMRILAVREFNTRLKETAIMIAKVAVSTAMALL